jgi:hypothetical protein
MNIKIRTGLNPPAVNDLQDKQLGYSTSDKNLWIKDANEIIKLSGGVMRKAAGLIPNAGNTISASKNDLTVWVKKNSSGNLAEAGYSFTTARKSFYGYCAAWGGSSAEYRTGSGTSESVTMDNDAGYSSGSMYTGQIIDLDNNIPYQFSITCGNNGTSGRADWAGITIL